MQTPVKLTLEQYLQARRDFLEKKTLAWPSTGSLECVECGSAIRAQAATLDVHARALPGCEGDGETMETAVPYCPNCEELPSSRGCVHG